MKITQQDIAHLSDDNVKRLTLVAHDVAAVGGPLASFWTEMQNAAIWALKERRRVVAHLEQSYLDDEDGAVGAIVGPDDDPVGDAIRALREGR